LDEQAQYSIFTLNEPPRVVIDLSDSTKAASTTALNFEDSPINALRSGIRNGTNVRVVLDLSREVNPSSFTLEPSGEQKNRLVVDHYDMGRAPVIPAIVPQVEEEVASSGRYIIVAIDAGHRGEDPGALGYDCRIRENDVALVIFRAIYHRLLAVPGYEPVMIRDGDYSVQFK